MSEVADPPDVLAPPAVDEPLQRFDADDPDGLAQQAWTAVVLSLIGMGLHATGCCTSVLGIMLGTVLGASGAFMAHQLRQQELTGEARAYASIAWGTGLFATIWGLIVGLGIAAYIGLYVVAIVMAVVFG